jgi:hypothetical protein
MAGFNAKLAQRDVHLRARHRCSGFPSTNASEANAPFYVGDGRIKLKTLKTNNDAWHGYCTNKRRFRKLLSGLDFIGVPAQQDWMGKTVTGID